MYEKYFKRLFDIMFSGSALIVLSPILFIVYILVKINFGSPIIFVQQRPGLKGKVFSMYKFRTMTNEKDQFGNLLADEERLSKFGKILRSTSIDELPELWNILRGDMSIVGPRPLLVQYLPLYNEYQTRRHLTRPGLTGLAQVNGRNALSWEEKFKWDVEYVENITFIGDIKIIIKTIVLVIKGANITSENSATMEKFLGNK